MMIEDDDVKVVKYIDDRMIETPSIALVILLKKHLRMGEKSKNSLDSAMDGIIRKIRNKIYLKH